MTSETLRKAFFNTGVVLIAVGPAVLGIGTAKEHLSRYLVLPEDMEQVSLIAGIGLTVAGLIALIASMLISPTRIILDEFEDRDRYVCLFARKPDLERLRTIYAEYFGSQVLSLDVMHLIAQRYRKAFAMVYLVERDSIEMRKQSLVGSFKVLRVTREAVQGLESRQLTGSTLEPYHIAKRHRDAAGFYVGDVFATTKVARGMVMAYINAACEPAIKDKLPIYARPLTRDGRRAMKRRGFVRVVDGKSPPEIGEMCRLVVSGHS